ncbi:MAG: DUF6179 domain-containing protein [bacterium]|nr:DUF6179 domain-containing protein [bacterium]
MSFLYEMEELVPLVAQLTEKYTSKESTSVTYETARQLMEAIIYCIKKGISGQTLAGGRKLAAAQAYAYGYDCLVDKIKRTQEKYNDLITNFCAYGNRNYAATVEQAIPGFFLHYDARFHPQNTIITMDYPTMISALDQCGIDAIAQYIDYISYEQRFLNALPKQYVYEVLERFPDDTRSCFDNICRIVLRNVLGHLLIGKGFFEEIYEENYEKLEDLVANKPDEWMKTTIEMLLDKLIDEQFDADAGMKEYFSADIESFVVQLKNAAKYHSIKQVVAL